MMLMMLMTMIMMTMMIMMGLEPGTPRFRAIISPDGLPLKPGDVHDLDDFGVIGNSSWKLPAPSM